MRACGRVEVPALEAPRAGAAARTSTRPVFWQELGGYAPTPVVGLEGTGVVPGRLEVRCSSSCRTR